MLKEVHLSHLPSDLVLYVAIYKDVTNASFLRDQLLAGNSDFEYAFLDASMILSTTHLFSAAFRAINDFLNNRLKSRNVHSEIVFAFSPNNNIAESFRKFGVTNTTRDLVAIKVATSPEIEAEVVEHHLTSTIQGTAVEVNDDILYAMRDTAKIKKVYKLMNLGQGERSKKGETMSNGESNMAASDAELETAVLGTMALRGAT